MTYRTKELINILLSSNFIPRGLQKHRASPTYRVERTKSDTSNFEKIVIFLEDVKDYAKEKAPDVKGSMGKLVKLYVRALFSMTKTII